MTVTGATTVVLAARARSSPAAPVIAFFPDSIDLDVERNVLTVRAERVARDGDWESLAAERAKPRKIEISQDGGSARSGEPAQLNR